MEKLKFDKGKLRYDLIPAEILEALAEIFTYGFEKYAKPFSKEKSGWEQVEIERYEAAMMRHYVAWKKGEEVDKESYYHHLKHMLWNAGVIMYLATRKENECEDECNCPDCRYMS